MARYDAAAEVISLDHVLIYRTEVRPETTVKTYMTTSARVMVSVFIPKIERYVDFTGNIDEVARLIDDMRRALEYVKAADRDRRMQLGKAR